MKHARYVMNHFYLTNCHRHKCNLLQIGFSMTDVTQQAWHPLSYWRTFPLCKHSTCCIRLHSSLFTHALSIDVRQRGDPQYSTLSWMNLGTFAVNILHRPREHCLTARAIIQLYRELWNLLSSSNRMFDVYLYTRYAPYPRNLWGKL